MNNPCKECIVRVMCKEKIYTECDILAAYLRSLKPNIDYELTDEAKDVLKCDILWWSRDPENNMLAFYRERQGPQRLHISLCYDSYAYQKGIWHQRPVRRRG
jgi:hypothetical protein